MTEERVKELIREVLAEKTPYRGGWFTADCSEREQVRRWRDPQTGHVWDDPTKIASRCHVRNFDFTYTNVRWEDDEPAKIDDWIPWTGSGCPVDPSTTVIVRLRDGWESRPSVAGNWGWGGRSTSSSIVAYRIVGPAKTQWPPAGLPVLVRWVKPGSWVYAESLGDGNFRRSSAGEGAKAHAWKYIPANWELAPEWAEQWVITSLGSQFWSGVTIKVGMAMAEGGYAVHVESRPGEKA